MFSLNPASLLPQGGEEPTTFTDIPADAKPIKATGGWDNDPIVEAGSKGGWDNDPVVEEENLSFWDKEVRDVKKVGNELIGMGKQAINSLIGGAAAGGQVALDPITRPFGIDRRPLEEKVQSAMKAGEIFNIPKEQDAINEKMKEFQEYYQGEIYKNVEPVLGEGAAMAAQKLPEVVGVLIGSGAIARRAGRQELGYGPEKATPEAPSQALKTELDKAPAKVEEPVPVKDPEQMNLWEYDPIEVGPPRRQMDLFDEHKGAWEPPKPKAPEETSVQTPKGLERIIEEEASHQARDRETGELQPTRNADYLDEAFEKKQPTAMENAFLKSLGSGRVGMMDLESLGKFGKEFKGLFNKDALAQLRKVVDSVTDHLAIIKPTDFRNYSARMEQGEFYPNRYDNIRQAIKEGGLDAIPRLEVEKIGDQWTVVNHDGRHRSDIFLEQGQKNMPVIIKDVSDTPGQFLRENPRSIRGQDMETIMPNPIYKERSMDSHNLSTLGMGPVKVYNQWAKWMAGRRGQGAPKDPNRTQQLANAADESTLDYIGRTKKPGPNDDVRFRYGMSTASYRGVNKVIKKPGNIGEETLLHFDNKLKDALRGEHNMNSEFAPTFEGLRSHYGMDKFLKKIDLEKYKKDIAVVLKVENDLSWRQGREWYPSEAQLVDMGMTPESAKVWKKVYDSMERAWDILEKTLNMAGVQMPLRVPGYVPHIFKGPYAVRVFKPEPTIKDPDGKAYLAEYNYYSKAEMEAATEAINRQLEGNGEGWVTETHLPSPHGNSVHDILNGLYRAQSVTENAKGLGTLIQAVYDSAAKGIINAALNRSNPTKIGHMLERLNETDPLYKLDKQQVRESLTAFEDATKAISAWNHRVKFTTETLFPLQQSGYIRPGSNVEHAARGYMESYFKIPNAMAKELDTLVKDHLIAMGSDPGIAHRVSEMTNTTFAHYYLLTNIPFYIVNTLQSTVSIPNIMLKQAIGHLHGEKTGSIPKALAGATEEMKRVVDLNEDKSPLLKWAKSNGVLDSIGTEFIDPSKFNNPVARAIEQRTRYNSFVIGYNYYKQIMPEDNAKRAALEFTNEVAVPYNQQVGAPNWTSKLPVVARPLVMFMTYSQHMLGMMNQQWQVGKRAAKEGNIPAASKALMSAMSLQGMNTALYGVGGAAFVQNYNDIIRALNRVFNTTFETSEEFGRRIDKALNTDGLATFGAVSKLLKYDVSPSATGVGFQTPGAGINAFSNIIEALALSGKWAVTGGDVSKQEVWEVVRKQPHAIQGSLEYLLRQKNFDTAALKDHLLKGEKRTVTDQVLRGLTGLRSLEEKSYLASERLLEVEDQRLQRKVHKLSQRIREQGMTKENITEMNEILQETKGNPAQFIGVIEKAQRDQQLTPDERALLRGTGSPRSGQRALRYLEERSYEPGRD